MNDFTCPKCRELIPLTAEKMSDAVQCPHCDKMIPLKEVNKGAEENAAVDSLIVGIQRGADPTQRSQLEPLSIEGLLSEQSDQESWHLRCHVCDSVLTANKSQLGSQIKCNDCYTMLDVTAPPVKAKQSGRPGGVEKPRFVRSPIERVDGSDLEIVEDDELTLLPPVELPQDLVAAQVESLLPIDAGHGDAEFEQVDVDADADADMTLGPLEVEAGSFELSAPASDNSELEAQSFESDGDADDSDEMIELLDVPPDIVNQTIDVSAAEPIADQRELPYVPRQKKHQPKQKTKTRKKNESAAGATNTASADDSPIRVHAKKRKRKSSDIEERGSNNPKHRTEFRFAESSLYEILDRSLGILKTGNLWIGAVVAIAMMSLGSAVWHGVGLNELAEDVSMVQKMIKYLIAITIGQGIFLAGYVTLMYLSAIVFRETAQGNDRVESLVPTDAAAFFSTMLLFGFSMFIGMLPFVLLLAGLWVPLQFFLAGVFLFCAWQNRSAFAIVSGDIFTSFSQHSTSWKTWGTATAAAAGVGWVGGCLMTLAWPVVSIFTSIAGAILLVAATLFYATISGWHAGGYSETTAES